jgi:hypothetical protein
LARSTDHFNLMDAFRLVQPHTPDASTVTQIDFREALLRHRMKADKVSMDRIYLFFKRYNVRNDDLLSYAEFTYAICPVDDKEGHLLRCRPPLY